MAPSTDWTKKTGFPPSSSPYPDRKTVQYINLKLAALGCPTYRLGEEDHFLEMAESLLSSQREAARLLEGHLCPVDRRIQNFLDAYLSDTSMQPKLPGRTFILDRHGLARALSIPPDADHHASEILQSVRIRQGILHNPKSDRRTTQGVFHVAEGGLPIPDDKRAVPKEAFARMLQVALRPPAELLELPFTSRLENPGGSLISLLLRPVVSPEVPGFIEQKSLEVRFFAPGSLVSNLDFVESIFGNGGNPELPENDSALDVEHWTGHTGCVILAPHLVRCHKKDLGLPHFDQATERQKRDGMCWKEPDELYNGGSAFKVTARDARGVIVTLIADNYFGYCKKEVKTQIGYSANLYGLCEEEHAGGAMAYPSYDLGEEFSGHLHVRRQNHSFQEVISMYGDFLEIHPEGYAIDKKYPELVYVPESVHFDLKSQRVSWPDGNETRSIKLLPDKVYIRPSGYKVRMEKPPGRRAWRLIGTVAEGTSCHKPCTVSGGGKSEISKPITDAIIQGPVIVRDFKEDFDQVVAIIDRDYSDRFKDNELRSKDSRPILSSERSLGSVIKLLTPSERDYTDSYNQWLGRIPQYIRELVFVVKRFYKPEWGADWRGHFSVDYLDGTPANELKCDGRKLVSNFLRVGFDRDGSWRTFGLRKDFHPADKVQTQDDITASITVGVGNLPGLNPDYKNPSVKFIHNCEYRLFQRPDEAIHRGYDKQTEADLAAPGNFISNFEPLNQQDARDLIDDSIGFVEFTPAMQNLIRAAATEDKPAYFVSSAHPRMVDGLPSKNPRYLQLRPDLLMARDLHLNEMATRLHRRVGPAEPLYTPVNSVLPGRRNNPPEASGIRPLAVYNPIHYMELPELFIEFICSMTGKSPSTTGAGSEGALTKGPFNALPPIIDLNNALVSYLLTGYGAFITAAGYVGPHCRVDHDISLLIPELWCRMTPDERDPRNLIENGYLERCTDIAFEGRTLPVNRLGYRITRRFVVTYFGRIFNHPHVVITEEMLRPELQDMAIFAEGMDNIAATFKRVAAHYFSDGSIEHACPPLKALLHIMKDDAYEGMDLSHPEIRGLFTRESLLASAWYAERLKSKQRAEVTLWERHTAALENFLGRSSHAVEAQRLDIAGRLENARAHHQKVSSAAYLQTLQGSIGRDPMCDL